ncbi:phosphate acetyltransferase [Campylobacter sp. LR264d]|uniref:phosphate acetyltransferase n=1 Tax=Campylobacter sp. LR264d TaxID=2593544 RepID=UPI001238D37E|nr:phosphate acetyltransferase [Campylobacter sp. LR264d]KAA6233841.1 phosphate acetyltransferase [Campylobacter sp. LR264d]
MTNLYLINSKQKALNLAVIKRVLTIYTQSGKSVGLYCPVIKKKELGRYGSLANEFKLNQENIFFSFTLRDALLAYNNGKNDFYSKIIKDYEEIKAKYDFVIIIGLANLSIFDTLATHVKIAKNLNTAVAYVSDDKNKDIACGYLNEALRGENFAILNEDFEEKELEKLKEYDFLTTYRFKFKLTEQLVASKKTIVLPESDDDRILKASDILLKNNLVNLILLGDKENIDKRSKELGLNLQDMKVINPLNSEFNDEFANILFELRKAKGLTLEKAQELIKDRNYFGTMLIHTQKADAMVSGASTTTADTIRPALQIIKTKEGINSVSGIFFMGLENDVFAFADCAVNPNPTPEQLAQSAYVSAITAKSFGLEPRIAMLSYSTGTSGQGPSVDLVNEALKIAKEKYPDLQIDGPLQFDAANDKIVAKKKLPDSKIAGRATVYIFPDLNAANICYKAVQRTANAIAMGPLLQGLKKPVNDLSRGCLIEDIVDTVLLTAIQSQ